MMHIKLLCTPLLMVLRFQTLVTNSSCHAFDRWQEWPRVTALIRGTSLHIPSWNSKWSEMDGVRGIKFCSVPTQRTGGSRAANPISVGCEIRSTVRELEMNGFHCDSIWLKNCSFRNLYCDHG